MYGTYAKQKSDTNYHISKIRDAIKFASDDFNTKEVDNENNKNYGGYLNKSYKLESFLNCTFYINYDINSIISFIINKGLFEIILELPRLIDNNFNTFNLNLSLENKYPDEKWIVVKIFTKLDGESASNQLDLLEDKLFEKYQDKFLDNILLSVEFE